MSNNVYEDKIRAYLFPILSNIIGAIALFILVDMRNDLKDATKANIVQDSKIEMLQKQGDVRESWYQGMIIQLGKPEDFYTVKKRK